MYNFASCLLVSVALSPSLMFAQIAFEGDILEKLHSSEVPWMVTDAAGSSINLVDELQPGQVLLVMPVQRSWNMLNQLAPFEDVLEILGESGSQQISMALVEISDHDLASDSWVSETSIPIYSGPFATLTDIANDDPDRTYTTIQKLQDGSLIEARRFRPFSDWWTRPLFSLLYQSNNYFNFENTENSFLTLNAGFPALEDTWCDVVGCQVEDLETYALGAGASESDPSLWQAWSGLVGTSQDGTVVQDPTNPDNKVLELKTDSVNGDVGFANKHLHVFADYEIEFDMLRRENKGASFIGFLGEFGDPTTLLGQGLNYTGYFGRLYTNQDGEASTYWWERRGLDIDLAPETWHHIKVGISFRGEFIEVNGDVVWALPNTVAQTQPKFTAFNWWANPDIDSEFLIDNVFIRPIYRRVANDFEGCSNVNACNFNVAGSSAQELCEFPESGYDCDGECIQDSDNDGICDSVVGCTDPTHPVYDSAATESEECCTAYEDANSFWTERNAKGRLLRKYAWSLSRVVVTDSAETTIFYDSEEGGLDDYQADDQWLFQAEGENNLLVTSGTPSSLVYNNNYVTQNHLLSYSPEFGVYEMPEWRLTADYCSNASSIDFNVISLNSSSTLFTPGVTPNQGGAESSLRPTFLGVTDAQGVQCSGNDFQITTINDSVLIVKSILAGSAGDTYGLITFKAEPHEFDFCVLGCTDSGACNYEIVATYDDGTCTYFCESGCTDVDALNYEAGAVIDDGTCAFLCGFAGEEEVFDALNTFTEPGLLYEGLISLDLGFDAVVNNSLVVPLNYSNSAGGAFPIASLTPIAISGLPPGLEATVFPAGVALDPSSNECLELTGVPVVPGSFNVDVEANLSVLFGSNAVDFGDFSYTWTIEVTPGQNPISGCTYPDASNFLSYAGYDDGSCVFAGSPDPCPADVDGNGQVGAADLLEVLAFFGITCD